MTTANFNGWTYELARDRQLHLIEVAAQERLLRATRPASKRWQPNVQLLAFLRTWRLVTPWLQWSSPVDEASCN